MPSRTIRPTQAPEPAPFAYTVTAPAGFTAAAVFASWDGSGAFGDFRPCVSYYNADGVLLDRAFPTTGPVAAGDSADISYRPFDRSGGGTAPPPPPVSPLTFAQGEAIILGWPGDFTPIPFTTLGSHGVTVGADRWTIQTAGKYILQAQASLSVTGPVPNPIAAEADLSFGYIISAGTPGSAMWGNRFPLAIPVGQDWEITPSVSQLIAFPVGAVITFQVASNPTGTPRFGLGEWSIAKVG